MLALLAPVPAAATDSGGDARADESSVQFDDAASRSSTEPDDAGEANAEQVDPTSSPDPEQPSPATTLRAEEPDIEGEEGPETKPAAWDVPNQSLTASGATILNRGHVDIATIVEDGELLTRVKDTSESSDAIWRDPLDTVFQVLPPAEITVPDNPAYAFLGTAGSAIWQLNQTQQAELLWPGWSTEYLPVEATQGGIDWTLDSIEGPGEFALYQTDSFGSPMVIFATADGIGDRHTIPKNVHVHGSWAFTAEGTYCLGFTRSAILADGTAVASPSVIAFAVGDVAVAEVDPTDCFAEPDGKPETIDTTPIAGDLLTDDSTGGVTIDGPAAGFTAGQLMTAKVDVSRAGQWVSVWLHSTGLQPSPRWLGWFQVEPSGTIQFRLPGEVAVGEHTTVLKSRAGDLIGWDAVTVVASTSVPEPTAPPVADATPPSSTVAASQCVAGATILSSGHIDYGVRVIGGRVQSLVKDGTGRAPVWREPASTVLWLKPSSAVALTAPYASIGAVGSTVWQVPQTQNAQLIWLGWNTESVSTAEVSGPVTWTLDSVSGPGSVKLYLQGPFGGVQEMIFAGGGSTQVPLGKHVHGNWAFSAQGVYRITFTHTATLANGQRSSDTESLVIAVGDVDPAAAVRGGGGCGAVSAGLLDTADAERAAADAAAQAEADAAAAAAAERSIRRLQGADDVANTVAEASSSSSPVAALAATLGLLLLLGVAGGGVLLWRNRNAASVVPVPVPVPVSGE